MKSVLVCLLVTTALSQCPIINATQCCEGDSIFNEAASRCECQFDVPLDVDSSCLHNPTLQCQYPCLTCNNTSTECLMCPVHYLLEGTGCKSTASSVLGKVSITPSNIVYECLAGCQLCPSLTTCIECALTYKLNNTSECEPCPNGCRTCDASGCSSCFDGFYLSGSACSECGTGCLDCSSQGCTNCGQTYFNNGGTCSSCGQFCKICSASGCTECYANYVVPVGGSECVECLGSCSCSQGYYNNGGTCTICNETCSSCSSQFLCQSCVEGYVLDNNQECILPCPFPCLTCSNSLCTECYGGYTLQNDQCVADLSCNNGVCEHCPRGYYLSSNDCLSCSSNCERCSDDSTCTQCREGSYLISSGVCQSCPSGCSACISEEHCLVCESGLVMEKDGSIPVGNCLACTHYCATCLNYPHQCLTCTAGYSLQGNRCISNVNIGFDIKLNMGVSEFLVQANQFKRSILSGMGAQGSTSLVMLESVVDGSTDVSGKVIIEDSDQAQTYYSNLQSNAGSLQNFNVISVTAITANGFEPTPPVEESSNVVGIIVGSVFGGIVFIAGLVVAIRIATKKEESVTSGEYTIKDQTSSEPVDLGFQGTNDFEPSEVPESLDFGGEANPAQPANSMEPS